MQCIFWVRNMLLVIPIRGCIHVFTITWCGSAVCAWFPLLLCAFISSYSMLCSLFLLYISVQGTDMPHMIRAPLPGGCNVNALQWLLAAGDWGVWGAMDFVWLRLHVHVLTQWPLLCLTACHQLYSLWLGYDTACIVLGRAQEASCLGVTLSAWSVRTIMFGMFVLCKVVKLVQYGC